MAAFNRIDGTFVSTKCTFEERLLFKNAGWEFDSSLRKWVTTDPNKALVLKQYATNAAREFIGNYEAILYSQVAASLAEDTATEYPAPDGLAYLPFQKAGIEYALQRERTLIADAPGLGKTVQAIGVHNATNTENVLVICPASLKINWSREWRRWDVHGLSVGIAMSIPQRIKEKDADGNIYHKSVTFHDWPNTNVVIVNYDMLTTFDAQVKSRKWDLVVCDEAHLLKSLDAIRTKCVFGGLIKEVRKRGKLVSPKKVYEPVTADRHLYLTGTPILSKPVELWTLLKACDPNGLGKIWEDFVYEFCDAFQEQFGLNTSGASNLEKLNRTMRERFMVRRDKKSVLKDLPPKTRELIILPKDKLDKVVRKERSRVEKALDAYESLLGISEEDRDFRYISAVDSLADKLATVYDEHGGDSLDWDTLVTYLDEPDQILFNEISDAREEVALASLSLVSDIIVKLVECGEPVIAFLYHKSVVKAMTEKLRSIGLRVGVVTGQTSQKERQKAVDAFQAGDLDVILGNILAMGVGYTLTRSSYVVFGEIDWIPALLEQAEDRAWRHGQKNAVNILYPVVDGSITARMLQKLLERMGVIRLALDMVPT